MMAPGRSDERRDMKQAVTWAPGLSSLLFLPFDRALSQARVARIQARYTLALEWVRAPEAGRRRPTLQLLRRHPTALRESERIGQVALEQRWALAAAELLRLNAAAPLPAPVGATERARILALADAEVFLIHLKALDHQARHHGLATAYEVVSTWPLPPLGLAKDQTLTVLDAYQSLPKSTRHRQVLAVAGLRHQVPELPDWVLPRPVPAAAVDFIPVGPVSAIKEGQGKRYDCRGTTIAVFKSGGALYALDDTCPHRGGPLGKGDLEDGCVLCPLHGWAFELSTGKMRGNPNVAVTAYEVKQDGDTVAIGPPKKRG